MNITAQYQAFTASNPGFNFQSHEINDQLNWDGFDKENVQPAFKAFQRIYRLYPDSGVAAFIFNKGYRSAHDIAGRPQEAFAADIAQELQKSPEGGTDSDRLARHIWSQARTVVYQANLAAAAILSPKPNKADYDNESGLPKFQEGTPTWDTLFGPGYNAQVKECESIYGPPAYFTDLMRIIDTYITAASTHIPAGLALQERRPDLWQIELDCYSTYHELTYLEIANRVMASKLANDLQQDTAQYLATNFYPFSLPMNQPLQKIRMYLDHFGFTLADVFQRFQADAAQVARESLLLSIEKAGMINGTQAVSVETMYGLYSDETEDDLNSEAFFESKTGLLPGQAEALVYQQLRSKQWTGLNFEANTGAGANTITVPNSPTLQVTGNQTIEFWIYLNDMPAAGGNSEKTAILTKSADGEFDFELYVDNNDIILAYRCGNSENGGVYNYINVFTQMQLQTWYHVALIRDLTSQPPTLSSYSKDTAGNIYPIGGISFTEFTISASTGNVFIGANGYGGIPFNGMIAEVRIWDRVLSEAEIDNNMWRQLSGKERGLAAYWPVNEGYGKMLNDRSQNGNNGTLSEDLVTQWQTAANFFFGDFEENPALQQQLWINQQGTGTGYLDIIKPDPKDKTGWQIKYTDDSNQWTLVGRFIHLSNQLKWHYADTDWALKSIGSKGLTGDNDLPDMAIVNQLQKILKQPVDAVCALWSDMKTYGMGPDGASQTLFDRVFNTPNSFNNPNGLPDAAPYHPLYAKNDFYHDAPLKWHYRPKADDSDMANGLIRSSMLGALKLTDTDLNLILSYLREQALVPDLILSLKVENMSLLYRYASLPKWNALPVEQFLQMLRLLGNPALDNQVIVLDICEWAAWLKKCGLNIYQLEYLCNGTLLPQIAKTYVQPDVDAFLQQLNKTAAPTLFSVTELPGAGLLPDMAAKIFEAISSAGFCDPYGVILDEAPINAFNVYKILAPVLGSPAINDEGAAKDLLNSIDSSTVDLATLPVSLQAQLQAAVQDTAFIATLHITRVLQNCREAQTGLVLQQLASFYRIPVQQMGVVLEVVEGQLPSGPVFNAASSMALTIPFNASINPVQVTISFWVQFDSAGTTAGIQTLYSNISGETGLQLSYIHDRFSFRVGLADGTQVDLPGILKPGKWGHILLSLDTPANDTTPYTWSINGKAGSGTIAGAYTPASSGDTSIGYLPGDGNYFNGRLIDFRLYNYYAADRTAIVTEMNAKDPAQYGESLCVWLPFNSRDNATVYDWSASGANGTLSTNANGGAGSWQWSDYGSRQLLSASMDTTRLPDACVLIKQLTLMTAWAKWFKLSGGEVALIQVNPQPFAITAMRYGFNFELTQLRAFATYKTLYAGYKLPGPVLLEYFNTPDSDSNKINKLANTMGWPVDQLSLLEANFAYGAKPLAFPKDYADFNTVNGVNSLSRCFEISSALGVNIAFFLQLRQLSGLALITGDAATDDNHWSHYVNAAQSLEQAVNANYTTNELKGVLQPIQDNVQMLTRDVMSALLIWELGNTLAGIHTQQDLYEYLLIDVRTTGAVQMSVLKAGLNSLQLYIQRCLSNMENGVNCTLPKEWWSWLGSYREWEANREVYLYPENYVDPSLRRQQSSLFKNLVTQVKQQTASEENITAAYLAYLNGLKEISSLHIVDSYARPIPGNDSNGRIIDVFGRTLTSPVTYYHRKAVVSDPSSAEVSWTPWEDIGLVISSDYITPIFAFGKLFIFWVEQTRSSTNMGSSSYPYIKATIYYSFQKTGSGWVTPQTLCSDLIIKTYGSKGEVAGYYLDFQLNGFNSLSLYENTKPWNKVTAMLTQAGAGGEPKIMITLGDWVTAVNDTDFTYNSGVTPATAEQREVVNYLQMLNDIILALTDKGKVTTVVPALLLDAGLRTEKQMPLIDVSAIACYNGVLVEGPDSPVLGFLTTSGIEALTGHTAGAEAFIKNTPENNIYHAWYDTMGTKSAAGSSVTGPFGTYITCLDFTTNGSPMLGFTTIPDLLAPAYKEFTLGMWIKPDSLSQTQVLLDMADIDTGAGTGKGSSVSIYYEDGKAQISYQVYTTPDSCINFCVDISGKSPGNWYYVVVSNGLQSTYLGFYDPSTDAWLYGKEQITEYKIPHRNFCVGYQSVYISKINSSDYSGYITGLQFFNSAVTDESFFDILAGKTADGTGLASLPKLGSSLAPIKNQPGWFLLNAGKESFMVMPVGSGNGPVGTANATYNKGYVSVTVQSAGKQPASVPQYNFVRTSTGVVDDLIEAVFSGGIGAMLKPSNQILPEPAFKLYSPNTSRVIQPDPLMDFNGAYGLYFWELFFQAPFYCAGNLQLNLKFLLAKKWYEYIFDPTIAPAAAGSEPDYVIPGLIGFWPLDTPAKNLEVRSLTSNGDGGVTGKLSWSLQDLLPFSKTARGINYFNGSESYISVPYNQVFNTTQFSLSFWIYLDEDLPVNTSGFSNAYVISSVYGNTGYQVQLYKWEQDATTFLIDVFDINGQNNELQGDFSIPVKTWCQLIICSDGSSYSVNVRTQNDADFSQSSKTLSAAFAPNKVQALTFGGASFSGYLANIAFGDVCLSGEQISSLAAQPGYPVSLDTCQRATRPGERFWQFMPFRELSYTSLYSNLTSTWGQYLLYEYDPFNPDAIAGQRPSAYAKGIFMRYVSNLIDFGDNLFTQDTWESITEATMYYVLAADLLGRLPKQSATEKRQKPATYNSIEDTLGTTGVPAFLIDLETMPALPSGLGRMETAALEQRWSVFSAYFGIPGNAQLLTYRKTIEDRLYKIRHGLNINGQTNNIPLFEPPINPADAAAAAGPGGAGGGSITAAPTSVPYYRFSYLADVARSFTSDVIRLGDELLAALEKQDGEYLSLLRETQGNAIYNMMTQIKQDQINQLYAEQSNLQASLQNAQLEQDTYRSWIGESWNSYETEELKRQKEAVTALEIAAAITLTSSPLYLFPTIFGLADGGMNFGGAILAIGQSFSEGAGILNSTAATLGIKGNFERTNDQWDLQMNLAGNSITGINAQLQANNFAIQVAEQDYSVNQTQIAQSNAVISFLQTKFTNQELYEWMASEVSSVYYQAYQMACGLAQMAQTAYQFELSATGTYINTSSWSNQYKGLLAGDALMLSINQLQQAYVKQNSRSLEISRTISLARLSPVALMNLKTKGSCQFNLTEYLFDTDFPGHYDRKIKTIAITIPAIVGPYQNIKATLVQTSNAVVTTASNSAVSYLLGTTHTMPADGSIRMNWNPGQEIALSSGSSDNGMFQLNYSDERFLPFENTGAVSSWQFSMPKAANQFDFNSINDVIVELKYCATDGGSTFKQAVINGNPVLQQYSGNQMISLRQQFGDAWQQFLSTMQTSVELVNKMYPPNLDSVFLVPATNASVSLIPVLSDPALLGEIGAITLDGSEPDVVSQVCDIKFASPVPVAPGVAVKWLFSATITEGSALLTGNNTIDPKKWVDVILVIPYSGALSW